MVAVPTENFMDLTMQTFARNDPMARAQMVGDVGLMHADY